MAKRLALDICTETMLAAETPRRGGWLGHKESLGPIFKVRQCPCPRDWAGALAARPWCPVTAELGSGQWASQPHGPQAQPHSQLSWEPLPLLNLVPIWTVGRLEWSVFQKGFFFPKIEK